MASYPRREITADPNEVACYMLTNRFVRQAWLCGIDQETGRDYEHRKSWVENRILDLCSNVFFLDLHTYVIMSNHFHVAVSTRPDLSALASDIEIIQRWWNLYPRRINGVVPKVPPAELVKKWSKSKKWMKNKRKRLCSISWFMGKLTEYLSRRINHEDGTKGRLWQDRFDSRLILDPAACFSVIAYIDLNPIKAGVVDSVSEIEKCGVVSRLKQASTKSENKDSPLLSLNSESLKHLELAPRIALEISLQTYIQRLNILAAEIVKSREKTNAEKNREDPSKSPLSYRFAMGEPGLMNEFAKKRGRRRTNRKKKLDPLLL